MSVLMSLWRIGTDTPNYTADDLSGSGAKISGGRWNRPGTALVYAASSQALACLETVVHLGSDALPLNRYLVHITIPLPQFSVTQFQEGAHVGWDALPAGKVSLDWGDAWAKSNTSLVAKVPSVVVPDEFNYLINPLHPDAHLVSAVKVKRWLYDPRL